MNPILKIVHAFEVDLDRRLNDEEYNQLVMQIESQITMMNLNNWANNLPQEIKESILHG